MSVYTAGIKSWNIDPQFHKSKLRDEFRLDRGYPALFYSTLRILNIGVVTDKQQTRYNYLTGAHGAIKNIYLMDGKRVLDQLISAAPYMGFQNQMKPNASQMDVDKKLKCNGIAFCYNRDAQTGNAYTPAKITEWFSNAPNTPTADETTTPLSYLDLKAVFPMLRNTDFLHSSVFPDLKVIIEYDVSKSLIIDSQPNPSVVVSTATPLLVVDEILNKELADKVLREFKGVSWNCIENEKVSLAQNEDKKTWQLTGANNKTVNRMLVVKTTSGDSGSQLYRNCGSEAMVGEDFVLTVNGSSLMPNAPTRPNHLLGLLTDTYGNMVAHTGSNDTGFYGADARFSDNYNARIGALSYFGIDIGQPITKNIQLYYSREFRTGDAVSKYHIPLTMNVYYEVAKAIQMTKDGSYQVVYL